MLCSGVNNRCELCRSGRVFDSTTKNCSITCPAGQASAGVNSPCSDCGSGTYQPLSTAIAYNCTSCIAGQYTDLTKQSNCKSCIEGKFSVGVGMISAATCLICSAGKYGDPGGSQSTNCKACVAGQYNGLITQIGCTNCTQGKYSDGIGMISVDTCVDCVIGTYADAGPGQGSVSSCKVCAVGQYSSITGVTKCELCPMGKNLIETGTADDHDNSNDCTDCPKMQFNPYLGRGASCYFCITARVTGSTECKTPILSFFLSNPTCLNILTNSNFFFNSLLLLSYYSLTTLLLLSYYGTRTRYSLATFYSYYSLTTR